MRSRSLLFSSSLSCCMNHFYFVSWTIKLIWYALQIFGIIIIYYYKEVDVFMLSFLCLILHEFHMNANLKKPEKLIKISPVGRLQEINILSIKMRIHCFFPYHLMVLYCSEFQIWEVLELPHPASKKLSLSLIFCCCCCCYCCFFMSASATFRW